MAFYNRRDFALTFARDRRCGTARRILDFAAHEAPEGIRPDTLYWAPAPLRSVLNGITELLVDRGLTKDVVMYVFTFVDPHEDLSGLEWRLPLPPRLAHPPMPASIASQVAAALATTTSSTAADKAEQQQQPALPPPDAAQIQNAVRHARLFRCSLHPPAHGPTNLLVARVLTPHRHLSNEELNMYLGRYGFVNSEPLSSEGFVISEAESTANTAAHRAGQIRVLLFLVKVDSPQLAARAIESCLVAQIDFLSWAVQVPYDFSVNGGNSATAETSSSSVAATAAAHNHITLSAEERQLLDELDHDPCVFPLCCLPPPGKLWLNPLVDVDRIVRRRRQRAAADTMMLGGVMVGGDGGAEGWHVGATSADDGLSDIRLLPEIIVDGIPYWVSDETLLTRCAEFGTVKRIRFSTCDRNGAHCGCAAVTMSSVSEAVRLHDQLDGRLIEGGTVRCGILEAYVPSDEEQQQQKQLQQKQQQNAANVAGGGSKSAKVTTTTAQQQQDNDAAHQVRYRLVSLRTGLPIYDEEDEQMMGGYSM